MHTHFQSLNSSLIPIYDPLNGNREITFLYSLNPSRSKVYFSDRVSPI